MKRIKVLLVMFIAAALLAGCDRDKPAKGTATADALPAGLVLSAAPPDAKGVSDVKKDAAKDREVVVTGVVAGAVAPMAVNRAVFTLADASLTTCDKMPGDTCKTPWDACCSDQAEIVAKTITVQVVGVDGKPLRAGLTGVGGLAPLKQVTVKGKVRSVDGEGGKRAVLIDAAGIFVKG